MKFLVPSTGIEEPGSQAAFVLMVASHKGGTGRTTAALALAWHFGQAGLRVRLIDTDPTGAASLIAVRGQGGCRWRNVSVVASANPVLAATDDADVVVVDAPSLTDPASRAWLAAADGVVLTCLVDPLSLRTLPAATAALQNVPESKARLLGVLLNLVDEAHPVQAGLLSQLERDCQELLLSPVVPLQTEIRDWALSPGMDPPYGPARDAYAALAKVVTEQVGLAALA